MEALGDRLSHLRKKQGLSREEIASMIETTDRQIESWENGKQRPSVHYLKVMAQVYEVDVTQLLPKRKLKTKTMNHILIAAEGGQGTLYLRDNRSQPFHPKVVIKNVRILEIKSGLMKVQVGDEELTRHMILLSDVIGFLEEMN